MTTRGNMRQPCSSGAERRTHRVAWRMDGLFREARTRSGAALAAWTVAQSAALWIVALVALPTALLRLEAAWGIARFTFPGQIPVAVVLFAACSVLNASAGAAMVRWGRGTPLPTACAPRLVARGPYAWVRNPMALFGLGQGVAVGLGLGSWLMLAVTVAAGVAWHAVVRPAEEVDLARRLGAEYADYRASVRCWLPRRAPYAAPRDVLAPFRSGGETPRSDAATPAPPRR